MRVLIIEFSNGHSELLDSHFKILKNLGAETFLAINKACYNNIDIAPHKLIYVEDEYTFIQKVKLILKLNQFIKKNNIQKIIFNTAEGNIIRFIAPFLKKVEMIGVLHHAHKLTESNSQKMICKWIKKYFVLGEYIERNLQETIDDLKIKCLYPIFYNQSHFSQHQDKYFNICIPGNIQFKRRDYKSLIDEVKLNQNSIPDNVQFILLGNIENGDGPAIKQMIEDAGISNFFRFFHEFVPNDTFYNELNGAKLLLPLITPQVNQYEEYTKSRISGTFSLSYGFKIPMILSSNFKHIEPFKDTSFISDDLIDTILHLKENEKKIQSMQNKIKNHPTFSLEHNCKNFEELLT
ncbi:hypothetical protein [Aureibacter tunicatorum]|uniref:Uncharacterized protein n=1 Tax=Aureibacter tunicatorum TaxID=866807 RepID=A0AAE4BRE2_9BACT|nr:hypothetical protein [Aureibacter tunicatorum]MDR6237853.1 hypothetical protein [Aureibacter tunicatorum]BDD02888.1 hypothetical protein AUTU_03710 [Aureibacter tunicatorum]